MKKFFNDNIALFVVLALGLAIFATVKVCKKAKTEIPAATEPVTSAAE